MDIRYLLFGDTPLHELVFQVVVGVEVRAVAVVLKPCLRRGQIAEHDLRSLDLLRVRPYLMDALRALVEFAPRLVPRFGDKAARI